MPINWTERLSKETIDSANYALSAFFLTAGEKRALSELYGVSYRTIQRWFADSNAQRRNCIPYELIGKRPCYLDAGKRTLYLRLRLCCAAGLGYGGITRVAPTTGTASVTVEKAPLLSDAIAVMDAVLGGEWHEFLTFMWETVYIEELPARDSDNNAWKVVVRYRRRAAAQDSPVETLPDKEDGEEYNENDVESEANFVFEPD